MNAYLVSFRFHVLDRVARRTWYVVEPYAGPELTGKHWVSEEGPYARWVSYVAAVPPFTDAEDYIDENLEHWDDLIIRQHFPRLAVMGGWERGGRLARSRA
jgi:hypothetical protein